MAESDSGGDTMKRADGGRLPAHRTHFLSLLRTSVSDAGAAELLLAHCTKPAGPLNALAVVAAGYSQCRNCGVYFLRARRPG